MAAMKQHWCPNYCLLWTCVQEYCSAGIQL